MSVKDAVRKLIPAPLLPLVQKVRAALRFGRPSYRSLPRQQLDALPALKARIWYNQYGGYCVPEGSIHRPAAMVIMHAGVHEPETIEFMLAHCAEGDIVHAGTYFGDFLPALSAGVAPGARIWAFEPVRENYRCAAITCLLNDLDNVDLQNAGLGEREETLPMRTRDESGRGLGGASQIVGSPGADAGGIESVAVVALDSVVPGDREVSIIQLDVEGHERSVLAGALDTIRRCKPILILEEFPGTPLFDSPWFAENILGLGYHEAGEVHCNRIYRADAL